MQSVIEGVPVDGGNGQERSGKRDNAIENRKYPENNTGTQQSSMNQV